MTAGTESFEVGPSDSALVARVLGGDQTAFAVVYDRYADRLYDFAHSMLRNTEDASDAVADAFIKFAERLSQLREPDRLRPWLYAIVRTECLRRLKSRSRVAFGGDEQLVDMPDTAAAPDEAIEIAALRQLVWDAADGLAERDRALLDLHLRQGLDGADLGDAMGVSASNAYVMMNRLRSQMERSLGALLVAKTGRDACSELDTSLDDWDGSFSPLVRKRVARHVDNCPKCTARRAAMVSPLALFAGVSAFAAPAGLRERVLNSLTLPPQPVVDPSPWLRRGILGGAGAVVVIVLVALLVGHTGDKTPKTRPVDATSVPTVAAPTASPSPTSSDTPAVRPPGTTPARLVISDHSVTIDEDSRSTSTRLSNQGGTPLTFELDPDDGWLSVSPDDGRLDPGESVSVHISVSRGDRSRKNENSSIDVDWTNGSDTISVKVKAKDQDDDDPPRPTTEPSPTTPVEPTPTDTETSPGCDGDCCGDGCGPVVN
jgi:RNA polymerase sigma factor (sigma-70 family)